MEKVNRALPSYVAQLEDALKSLAGTEIKITVNQIIAVELAPNQVENEVGIKSRWPRKPN